jgi:hypothetical protein
LGQTKNHIYEFFRLVGTWSWIKMIFIKRLGFRFLKFQRNTNNFILYILDNRLLIYLFILNRIFFCYFYIFRFLYFIKIFILVFNVLNFVFINLLKLILENREPINFSLAKFWRSIRLMNICILNDSGLVLLPAEYFHCFFVWAIFIRVKIYFYEKPLHL